MERRGAQQEKSNNGQTYWPPSHNSVQTKLLDLANRAKSIRNQSLKTLIHFIDKEWLEESWRKLRKGAAYGVDAVSSADYAVNLNENLDKLLYRMKAGKYNALPVKRVYIPKSDCNKRPLGLPTIEDKIAQNAVKLILNEVYEQEFLPQSYGFRPNKNAHQAIEDVKQTIAQKKISWVLDVDISSFFDEMSHDWLLKFVNHRIADKSMLKFIRKWLESGIMEDGKLTLTSSGSPQGGVISPVLANIYLHYVIDLWSNQVQKMSSDSPKVKRRQQKLCKSC